MRSVFLKRRSIPARIGLGIVLLSVALFGFLLWGPRSKVLSVQALKFEQPDGQEQWLVSVFHVKFLEVPQDSEYGSAGDLDRLYSQYGGKPLLLEPGKNHLKYSGGCWTPGEVGKSELELCFTLSGEQASFCHLDSGTVKLPLPMLQIDWRDMRDGQTLVKGNFPAGRWLYAEATLRKMPRICLYCPELYPCRMIVYGLLGMMVLTGWGIYRFFPEKFPEKRETAPPVGKL